jgi:uncharacterized protein (TIGR03546 family)
MTLLLKQIFGFLKLLNSDTGSTSISAGVAAGFILGMAPMLSLQGLLVLCLILIFRIQIGAAFISAFFFAFIAFILDPVFHSLGQSILTAPSLNASWTTLFNMPLVPLTRFNNTIVMGAGVVSIILCPFVFLMSKFMVNKYRIVVVA